MKETIEEAAEKYFNKNVSKPYSFEITQDNIEDGFKSGAEWQAKQMFTEEDMIDFNEWADTSSDSADFWRQNRRSPTMDNSYYIYMKEKRIELFNLWKKQFKNK
jgi:hypothetical protein